VSGIESDKLLYFLPGHKQILKNFLEFLSNRVHQLVYLIYVDIHVYFIRAFIQYNV